MTSLIILVICLVLLSISGHVWQFVKEAFRKDGIKRSASLGTLGVAFIFSSAAGAATFIMHIAEVTPK